MTSSEFIFEYLKKFETFCKYIIFENPVQEEADFEKDGLWYKENKIEETAFGINNIAFFDEYDEPLLFTITHEGYITIREDLWKQINKGR